MTYFKNVKYKVLVTLDDDGRRGGIGWLDINTLWRDAGGVLCRAVPVVVEPEAGGYVGNGNELPGAE